MSAVAPESAATGTPKAPGKARWMGPEARRPCSGRQADKPSRKGVAHMQLRLAGVLIGAALFLSAPASALAAAAPINVHFRAEGARSTLVSGRTVTLADAPIVKDGDPAHSCPGQTALGALHAGTQGDWQGTWSEGLGYFVNEILGERHSGTSFFSLWVDHKLATAGLCGANLKAGDDVLLFVDRCVFDATANKCTNKSVTPLGIRVPASARRGRTVLVTVVSYTNSGRARPVAGASVFANGQRLKPRTNRLGRLRLKATKIGRVTFFATHAGNARSAVGTTRVRKV